MVYDNHKLTILIQAGITVILLGIIGYLLVTGQSVPDILVNALTMILAFWFGTEVGYRNSSGG